MIKNDKWIKSKCIHQVAPLITPFIDKQVKEWERDATQKEVREISGMERDDAMTHLGANVRNVRVDPLLGVQIREKILSFGTSSFGYDVRLGDKFKIFTNVNSAVIDPLNMSDACYVDHKGPFCIIPPNSYILGHTIEVFDLPRNVVALCVGKSTYARAGAIVNVTPIEPGFMGQVVIEISNSTPLPLKVYANQGIAQFLFFESDEDCEVSYGDREGKYQNQRGLQTAIV